MSLPLDMFYPSRPSGQSEGVLTTTLNTREHFKSDIRIRLQDRWRRLPIGA